MPASFFGVMWAGRKTKVGVERSFHQIVNLVARLLRDVPADAARRGECSLTGSEVGVVGIPTLKVVLLLSTKTKVNVIFTVLYAVPRSALPVVRARRLLVELMTAVAESGHV